MNGEEHNLRSETKLANGTQESHTRRSGLTLMGVVIPWWVVVVLVLILAYVAYDQNWLGVKQTLRLPEYNVLQGNTESLPEDIKSLKRLMGIY